MPVESRNVVERRSSTISVCGSASAAPSSASRASTVARSISPAGTTTTASPARRRVTEKSGPPSMPRDLLRARGARPVRDFLSDGHGTSSGPLSTYALRNSSSALTRLGVERLAADQLVPGGGRDRVRHVRLVLEQQQVVAVVAVGDELLEPPDRAFGAVSAYWTSIRPCSSAWTVNSERRGALAVVDAVRGPVGRVDARRRRVGAVVGGRRRLRDVLGALVRRALELAAGGLGRALERRGLGPGVAVAVAVGSAGAAAIGLGGVVASASIGAGSLPSATENTSAPRPKIDRTVSRPARVKRLTTRRGNVAAAPNRLTGLWPRASTRCSRSPAGRCGSRTPGRSTFRSRAGRSSTSPRTT